MREYRLTAFWRFISYVLAIAFLTLAIYCLIKPLSTPFRLTHVFNYIGSALLILLAYGLYREARYGKFIIDFIAREITLISPFRKRTLPFDAIKGYRKIDRYLFIMPTNRKFKRIRLDNNMENNDEIKNWLFQNFPDIAELEALEDEKEIAQNEDLGTTEEARFQRVGEAKKAARIMNTIAWISLAWILFYPHPYTIAITVGILIPVVTLFICYFYNGLMKGGDKQKSGYPSVVIAFVLPGMVIALRSMLDNTILSYRNGWISIMLISVILYLLYLLPTQGLKPKNTTDYIFLCILPFFVFAYSFGSVVLI